MPAEPVPLIGQRQRVVGAEHGAEARHRLVEHREELGVHVAEQRPRERGRRLGVRVRRAGPEEQAVSDRHAPEIYERRRCDDRRVRPLDEERAPSARAAGSSTSLSTPCAGDEATRDFGRGAGDAR